jgi:hypothetical protein
MRFPLPMRTPPSQFARLSQTANDSPNISGSRSPGIKAKNGRTRPVHHRHGNPDLLLPPQVASQPGANENTNGLLRQHFPKTTNMSSLTEDDLDQAAYSLNTANLSPSSMASPA